MNESGIMENPKAARDRETLRCNRWVEVRSLLPRSRSMPTRRASMRATIECSAGRQTRGQSSRVLALTASVVGLVTLLAVARPSGGSDAPPVTWPVAVRAVDAAGLPLDDVEFTLIAPGRRFLASKWVRTGGAFVLPGVTVSPLTLIARLRSVPSEDPGATRTVEIVGRAPPESQIAFDTEPKLLVRVRRPSGESVQLSGELTGKIHTLWSSAFPAQFWGGAAADGGISFRRVVRGKPWTLFLRWTEQLGGTLFLSGDALEPGSIVVQLEEGSPIGGRIRAEIYRPSGRWETGVARISASRGAELVEGDLDYDGTFRFPRLPSGQWTIRVAYATKASSGTRIKNFTVDAKAGEVDLHLDGDGRRE